MKKVKFENEIYTVEEESMDFYHLSGNLWVKKSKCIEIEERIPRSTKILLMIMFGYFLAQIVRAWMS